MTNGFKYSHDSNQTLRNWEGGLNRLKAIVDSIINAVKWGRFIPVVNGDGSMTFTTQKSVIGVYLKLFKICFISVKADGTTGGTASNQFTCSLPIPASVNSTTIFVFSGLTYDTNLVSAVGYLAPDLSKEMVYIQKYDRSLYGLGVNRHFRISGFYEVD